MRRHAPLALAVVCLLAGCGGSAKPAGGAKVTGVDGYTERQVVDALNLRPDRYGVSYETLSGCTVNVIMTSRGQVDTYRAAGSPVVSNRAGTVGVKFDGTRKCADELAAAIAKLK